MHDIDALALVQPVVAPIVASDDVNCKLLFLIAEERRLADALAELLSLAMVRAAVVMEGRVRDVDEVGVANQRHLRNLRQVRERLGIPILHSLGKPLECLAMTPVSALQLCTDHLCGITLAHRPHACRCCWNRCFIHGGRRPWQCLRSCRIAAAAGCGWAAPLLRRQPCRTPNLRRRRRLVEEARHELRRSVGLGRLGRRMVRALQWRQLHIYTYVNRPTTRNTGVGSRYL